MKVLLASNFVLLVLGTALLYWLKTPRDTQSFAVGGLVSFLNLVTLIYSWPRILAKKQVALSISVIVFKFAILGWIIYVVASSQVFSLGWVAAGLALVLPSTLAASWSHGQASVKG